MSIKEKFIKIIGEPFRVFGDDELPEYVITLGPTRFMALIRVDKFSLVDKYEHFNVTIPFEQGYLSYEKECFNVTYVKKAKEVLNPNEYGVYRHYIDDKEDEGWVLILKKGNYGIMIAPAVKIKDTEEWPEVSIQSIVKKAPSGVMVL